MAERDLDEAGEWRLRYNESVCALESAEQRFEETENLLYRSISRLALAVHGLSEPIDRELGHLRVAVREKRDPRQIFELADQLGQCDRGEVAIGVPDPVLPASVGAETPQASTSGVVPDYAALINALDAKLGSQLPLEKLAKCTNDSEPMASATTVADVLGEAFLQRSRAATESRYAIAGLVEELPLSSALRTRSRALRDELEKTNDAATISSAMEIARALRGEIELERAEMRRYLEDLDSRLSDLGKNLSEQATDRLAVTQMRGRFNEQLDGEVEGMRQAVSEAVEIEPLRRAVSKRLSAIRAGMATVLASESERRTRIECSEASMRERLETIEKESTQLAERLDAAREAASHDSLTGCFNRAAFDAMLSEEYAAWCERSTPLSLHMWDIDHFKAINDTHGHRVGDMALKAVAAVLKKTVRSSDYVARYGGEEFVLVLRATSLETAAELAEALRQRIATTNFVYKGRQVDVTASCGVAEFSRGDTPATVLERADRALYRAKANGRNRVVTGRASQEGDGLDVSESA
jgi:diguanylate cyclase